MDPKLIAILRTLLKVDNKSLPDSMTPEQFGKFVDEQKGKLFGNPEDIKNLQKIITAKDTDLKKALEKLEKPSPKEKPKTEETPPNPEIVALTEEVKSLTGLVTDMKNSDELKNLTKLYPDLAPELLAGKNEDEQKKIVDKQRKINKRMYGDSTKFTKPNYESTDDVDKEIKAINEDTEIRGEAAAVKVIQLDRVKAGL